MNNTDGYAYSHTYDQPSQRRIIRPPIYYSEEEARTRKYWKWVRNAAIIGGTIAIIGGIAGMYHVEKNNKNTSEIRKTSGLENKTLR
ncbi:MAG: hypothetical protein AABW88_05015 [Nanoarchaeota archaeon]